MHPVTAIQDLLHSVYARINPVFLRERRLLRKSERFSRKQLDALKLARLQAICVHAYETCDYYNDLFRKHRLDPHRLGHPDELSVLPYLTKDIIQQNLDRLTSRKIPRARLEYTTTGGSTGVPLGFYMVKRDTYPRTYAYEWRQYNWGQVRFGDKRAILRGRVLSSPFLIQGKTLYLSSFHLTRERTADYVTALERFNPGYIESYPSSLLFLAEFMKARGQSIRIPNLKAIFLTSESIEDTQRRFLKDVFHAKVFTKYGNSEQATIIGMCERETLHEFEEYSLTEYLDDNNRPVREGSAWIVSTSFVNFATPFIRYKTDDQVELAGDHACPCGRVHRTVSRIVGRTQDYLVGEGGERITVAAINTHSDAFDGVLSFQYFQEQPGQAVIRVVPSQPLTDQQKQKILNEATFRSAGCIRFTVQEVESVEKTPRGKSRFIVRTF